MPTLDDLHLAMGEFLTESSAVEDMMLGLYIVCNPDRPMGEIFNDFVDQTFGGKIKKFKQACDAHPFTEEQRSILREVYSRIDAVLPKRNYIVHGTTYETRRRRRLHPTVPYWEKEGRPQLHEQGSQERFFRRECLLYFGYCERHT
ncbi:hypothetical protein ACVOMS_05640 [Bradyrhizobium guangxiense]